MDPAQYQDAIVGLDFAPCLGSELALTGIDLARLQRASEGAKESAGCCRDDVVDGRRVGVGNVARHAIVSGDRPVDSEPDWLGFGRQVGPA
jgi:hypothetical protein